MHDALIRAERVILLLSPEYLASNYCAAEWFNALSGDPLNQRGRLIVFRVRECAPQGLLNSLAYWDLVNVRDNPAQLEHIVLKAVKSERKPTVSPYWRPPRAVLQDLIHPLPYFTGRREDLAALDTALWNETAAVGMQVVLQGLGGVGKTALAIQYGWEQRERYAGVWLLNGDTSAGIVDGLLSLGATFIPGLEEVQDRAAAARTVLQFIAGAGFEKPWLLIYDDVTQANELDGLLPRAGAKVLDHLALARLEGPCRRRDTGHVFICRGREVSARAHKAHRCGRRSAPGCRTWPSAVGARPRRRLLHRDWKQLYRVCHALAATARGCAKGRELSVGRCRYFQPRDRAGGGKMLRGRNAYGHFGVARA